MITSSAETLPSGSIPASKLPSDSSKATLPPPARRPNSASFRRTNTGPASSAAETLLPTAMMSSPCFLKPRSPDNVTKSATFALKPFTANAIVSAAIACSNVYSRSTTWTVVPAATVVVAFVYWTITSSASMPARPSMPASKLPFESSKATLPLPAIRPKSASFSRTNTGPASSAAETSLPTATMSVPTFLKPRSPESVTKSATFAPNPRATKATVFAAIALSKV